MPPIALPIEIVHLQDLEPPRSGHLSTPAQRTARLAPNLYLENNLQKRTEAKTASTNHKNNIKLLTLLLR